MSTATCKTTDSEGSLGSSPVSSMSDSSVLVIKEEPVSSDSDADQLSATAAAPADEEEVKRDDDVEVFFKDFVKVEAIIGRKTIPQFLVPVDVPYQESRRVQSDKRLPHQPKVGKLKMRKLTELQMPKPVVPRIRRSDKSRIPFPISYSFCQCYHCIVRRPSFNHSERILPSPSTSSRPFLHPPTNASTLWRPFI